MCSISASSRDADISSTTDHVQQAKEWSVVEDLSASLEEADMLHLYGNGSSLAPYLGVITVATTK